MRGGRGGPGTGGPGAEAPAGSGAGAGAAAAAGAGAGGAEVEAAVLRTQMAHLGEDFRHNLRLLEDRDRELERLEGDAGVAKRAVQEERGGRAAAEEAAEAERRRTAELQAKLEEQRLLRERDQAQYVAGYESLEATLKAEYAQRARMAHEDYEATLATMREELGEAVRDAQRQVKDFAHAEAGERERALEEQLAAARREEQSLRQEVQDLADAVEDVNVRHRTNAQELEAQVKDRDSRLNAAVRECEQFRAQAATIPAYEEKLADLMNSLTAVEGTFAGEREEHERDVGVLNSRIEVLAAEVETRAGHEARAKALETELAEAKQKAVNAEANLRFASVEKQNLEAYQERVQALTAEMSKEEIRHRQQIKDIEGEMQKQAENFFESLEKEREAGRLAVQEAEDRAQGHRDELYKERAAVAAGNKAVQEVKLLREELKTLRGAAATDRQQAVQEAAALRHELDEVRAAAASASADAEEQCAEELRTLREEAEKGMALAAKADQERVQKLRAEQEARDQSKAAVDAAARGHRVAEAERDAISAQDNAASKMVRTESVHGNTTMESLGIQIQDKIQEQIETILREVVGSTVKVQPALDEIRQEVHSAKMAAENASLSARQAAQELSLARSGHGGGGGGIPSSAVPPMLATPTGGSGSELEELKREVQALKMSASKAPPAAPNPAVTPAGPGGGGLHGAPPQYPPPVATAPPSGQAAAPHGGAHWASPFQEGATGPEHLSTYHPSLPYMGELPHSGFPPSQWMPTSGTPFDYRTQGTSRLEHHSAGEEAKLPSFRSPAGFDADVRSSAGLSDAARRVLSIKEKISELHTQPSEGAGDGTAARQKNPRRRSRQGPAEDPARPSLRGLNRRMDILGQARRNLDTAYLDLGPPGPALMPRVWK